MSRNSTHTITITARDGSSQVFRLIGQSGQTMATQLDAATKRTNAGLGTVDAAAKKAGLSIRGIAQDADLLSAKGASVGASLATIAGLLSDAARAAAEEQAEFDRLQASIDATGASFDQYAGSVDTAVKAAMALSFADDQAVNALNALVTTTGDAEQSVELLGLAMDVARGRGLDLSTAATLVGRVASGNVGILQRYGIAIDDNATSTEALAALQERFAGQADAYAQSQVGAAARVKNALDDMLESVGASTGDLQGLLLILPGLSSAFTLTSGAIGAFAASEATAAVATRGLLVSLGPLGLALGGIAAAGAILVKSSKDQEAANRDLIASYDDLEAALTDYTAAQEARAKLSTFSLDPAEQERRFNEVNTLRPFPGKDELEDYYKRLQATVLTTEEQAEANRLMSASYKEATEAIRGTAIDAFARLRIEQENTFATGDDVLRVLKATTDILDEQGQGAELAQKWWAAIVDNYNAGIIDADRLAEELEWLNENLDDQIAAVVGAQDAFKAAGPVFEGSARYQYAIAKAADLATKALEEQADRARALAQIHSYGTEGLSSLYMAPSDKAREEADLIAVSTRNLEAKQRAAEEAARAEADAYRDAIGAAQDLIQAEESVTSAIESRDDALAAQSDLAAEHERDLASITKERVQAQKAAEHDLAQTVRGLQQEREQNERDLSQTLRQLDQERAQVAADTERQLADLAQRRGEIQADAAQQAAEAERDWLETSRDNLAQQAELRQELQQTTAEAAREWADLNRENLAQQRDIREELKRTLQEANIAFGREQDDIRREIAYTEEALKNAKGAGGGPYDAQAVADAKKRLEELNTELSRSTEDHKREEAQAKREARDQEKDLEAERKQAMEDYHDKVRQAEEDTAKRIQQLESDRMAAQQEFFRQQEDARNDAASQLADLAAQERSIMDEQGRKFTEIENQKRIAARDSAREQQKLAQETAKAERQAQAEILAAQKEAAKQAREAELQYREDAADAAERVRDAQAEVEAAVEKVNDQLAIVKKGAQGTVTVRTSQAMSNLAELRSELDDLLAQLNEDYNITLTVKGGDPEPLDGPVKNPNHIHGLHGVVVQPSMRAAMGRVVTVGESRPETLILPYGSMVVPDGGNRARAEGGTTITYIFPNARFEMRTADIAREISRQVATRER